MKSLFDRLLDYYHISKDDYALLTMEVTKDNFASGHEFIDMDNCVRVVKEAVDNKKKIFIYGDYDADGIMSVSILVKMFKMINYPVSYHIPNRYTDGYGLNLQRSQEIVDNGFDLLITVDNGITAFEGIEYAKNHGLQVLVFDHHQPSDTLPMADYILHPSVSKFGDTATSAGFVTFMFAKSYLGYFDNYLATLASISLVSDMMPLVSYNRNLLRLMIKEYQNHPFFNIDLLKEKEVFNEYNIGMKIAPKINAIGRLIDDDSYLSRSVEFFTSEDENLLLNYNDWINSVNDERKELTKEAVENSKEISTDLLEASGGHAMAGGCSVKKENYEAFKKGFIELASKCQKVETKSETIPLYINEITFENYDLINSFSPFGEAWPAPLFVLPRIRVQSLMYSRDGEHVLTSIGNNSRLTGFHFPKEYLSQYQFIDMIGTLRISTYYNKTNIEFLVNEINETK